LGKVAGSSREMDYLEKKKGAAANFNNCHFYGIGSIKQLDFHLQLKILQLSFPDCSI
jgi:hypothetical protein